MGKVSTIEKNIYYEQGRLLHPYQVRITRNSKQIFFRSCATIEDARREKELFLKTMIV